MNTQANMARKENGIIFAPSWITQVQPSGGFPDCCRNIAMWNSDNPRFVELMTKGGISIVPNRLHSIMVLYSDMNRDPKDMHYTKIWEGQVQTSLKSKEHILEEVFMAFNLFEGSAIHERVATTLCNRTVVVESKFFKQVRHTSMSVGDMVLLDGELYTVKMIGFERHAPSIF